MTCIFASVIHRHFLLDIYIEVVRIEDGGLGRYNKIYYYR